MKQLDTLQTLAKVGKVLSKIAFICAIVGTCGCIAGLISTTFGSSAITKIGGVTLHGILATSEEYNLKSISAGLTGWLIICAGEVVLAKFAENYFKNELAAGTPFTVKGAKELQRLGILAMAIPVGCTVVGEIVMGIVAGFMNVAVRGWLDPQLDHEGTIVLGIMFIIGSLVCRYGAQLEQR